MHNRESLFTFNCHDYSEKISDVIKLFNSIGWVFGNDFIEFLPLNDNDMFDWQRIKIESDTLLSLIDEKQKKSELAGVILYYLGTDNGITMLCRNTEEISISPNINRKTIENGFTDVNWYINNIMAKLEKSGCLLQRIDFTEYIG